MEPKLHFILCTKMRIIIIFFYTIKSEFLYFFRTLDVQNSQSLEFCSF